jgi:hypothetical protein
MNSFARAQAEGESFAPTSRRRGQCALVISTSHGARANFCSCSDSVAKRFWALERRRLFPDQGEAPPTFATQSANRRHRAFGPLKNKKAAN